MYTTCISRSIEALLEDHLMHYKTYKKYTGISAMGVQQDLRELYYKIYNCILTPSVQRHIYIFILLIHQFYTASETHVAIKILQTLTINLVDPT